MEDKRLLLTQSDIGRLPAFEGLPPNKIIQPKNHIEAQQALLDLTEAKWIGFDTESRPIFTKGQTSDGPHVLQFSTLQRAYIFQTHDEACIEVIRSLLGNAEIHKIGFDLKSDMAHIRRKFKVEPLGMIDISRSFKSLGYPHCIGVKSAIAILLKKQFQKSKSTSTSNWSVRDLSERQLTYAANDAYAAIQVFHKLREAGQLR